MRMLPVSDGSTCFCRGMWKQWWYLGVRYFCQVISIYFCHLWKKSNSYPKESLLGKILKVDITNFQEGGNAAFKLQELEQQVSKERKRANSWQLQWNAIHLPSVWKDNQTELQPQMTLPLFPQRWMPWKTHQHMPWEKMWWCFLQRAIEMY